MNNEEHIKDMLVENQAKEWGKQALEILDSSDASDVIIFPSDIDEYKTLCEELEETYLPNLPEKWECPADLFFSKTIPIKHLEVQEYKDRYSDTRWRIAIRDDYKEQVDNMKKEPQKPLIIGALDYYAYNNGSLFQGKYALVLLYGIDYVFLQHNTKTSRVFDTYVKDIALLKWYILQLAMLNPITKDIFSNPSKIVKSNKAKSKKKNRRITTYKKIHIINAGDITNAIKNAGTIERHCLCWYVIGHWRNYKNGNTVFIQGYWKGPLRETKKNHDDIRERKLEVKKDV